MASAAAGVAAYLKDLPDDRRDAIKTLRSLILANLPSGYEEALEYGMLSYQVPLAAYRDTYNKKPLMYVALASQKNHLALYLCHVYAIPALRKKFEAGFKTAGKKLDMGKACVRFKKLEDLALPVIGKTIAEVPMPDFIASARSVHSTEARAARSTKRRASKA